ncbi:ATP-binding protein [Agromyces protaetiae]|nr:ATP-binding protein [Agromyces protaetiae]
MERMTRPRACVATGVSAGLAAQLGVPVWAARLGFVVTGALGGFGVLLYLWLWAFTPWAEGEARPSRRAPVAWIFVTASTFAFVAAVVVESGGRTLDWPDASSAWAVSTLATIGLAVAAGAWAGFIDRPDSARGPRHELVIRIVATALLAAVAGWLVLGSGSSFAPMPSFLLALAAALGILAVFAPTLVTQWRELTEERTRRIRDEQRNEIAAHLHDSVLQTLALIQNRAGATSEVARIARAQERELRDWLYAGDAPVDRDLGTELRDFAADLEIDFPVTVDVVVVGETSERASGELAAAAREAMLNAARHAGGEVSVYVESSREQASVFVRDRGPGFALADVPGDRLGVRQSIIGRMKRAGGDAEVGVGPGGQGTEVRLRFPVRAVALAVSAAAVSAAGAPAAAAPAPLTVPAPEETHG